MPKQFIIKAQNLILNGSFENNLCGSAYYMNTTNSSYNSFMLNSTSFGSHGNIDIINDSALQYCGGNAEDGEWFIALTAGGTDACSLVLSNSIVQNNIYTISYYARRDSNLAELETPLRIGISNTNNLFGELIYSASSASLNCIWEQHVISFLAPINASYITITGGDTTSLNQGFGNNNQWVQLDNFVLDTGGTSGIEPIKNRNKQINLYPNPTTGKLYIGNFNKDEKGAYVQVSDISGKLISKEKYAINENTIELNLQVDNGVYFVKVVKDNGEIQVQKIIISR